MKKQIRQAPARREASAAVATNIRVMSDRLIEATAFVKANQAEILAKPVMELSKDVVIASFCVLRRMAAAVNRRLARVQPLVAEMFATMPEVSPGGAGHTIEAGPFKVHLHNKAQNRKVMDHAVLRDVLRSKRIAIRSVQTVLPAPEPVIDEDKVMILVREGKLTEKEYDSLFKAAPPQLELHVDVPEFLDNHIQTHLLGGMRETK